MCGASSSSGVWLLLPAISVAKSGVRRDRGPYKSPIRCRERRRVGGVSARSRFNIRPADRQRGSLLPGLRAAQQRDGVRKATSCLPCWVQMLMLATECRQLRAQLESAHEEEIQIRASVDRMRDLVEASAASRALAVRGPDRCWVGCWPLSSSSSPRSSPDH